MKISLFGGTGPTGKYIIREALSQGYKLSVYTRDAGKVSEFAGKIEVVVGDLQDTAAIAKCVEGADAVISALGPNSLKVKGDKPVMRGLSNIIAAMKQSGVRRLIQISTAAYRDPKDGFALKAHAFALLFKVIVRKAYEDGGIIDIGWYGKTKLSMKLSRGNLAKFLVDQVKNQGFVKAAPAIANRN